MEMAEILLEIGKNLFNGLALGSVIALAAVGLTITYGILRLSNFAHGDFMTLGAYFTWVANINGVPLIIAIVIGAIGVFLVMLISEKLLWQPMRNRRANSTTLIIISIGLALFIRNGILFIWGGDNQNYNIPILQSVTILGQDISYFIFIRLIIIIVALVAMMALHFFLQNSKIGKAMRAVADNIDLARVSGIKVELVVLWTWIITGILTAISGSMYGLITAIRPNMGWFLIIPMFASVILGGIGNPYGAIVGALAIGIAQELSVPLIGGEYKLGVALLIMIVILLIRPQGLFKSTIASK